MSPGRARPARTAPRRAPRAARACRRRWMTSGSSTIAPRAHARVERRVRILKDDLHVAAALRAARARRERRARPRPGTGPRPTSARSAAGGSGRSSSCRCPIRRPARTSRLPRSRSSRRRPRATSVPRRKSPPPRVKSLTRWRDVDERHHARLRPAGCSCRLVEIAPDVVIRLDARRRGGGVVHGSNRSGHRGWNAQPGGSWPSAGTRAVDRVQPAARRARPESTPAARACRDAPARRTAVAPAPVSTIRPAYITATRSAVSAIDAEVVGDEQQRQVERRLHLAQQVEDLRLDRDVERRRRLVGDDERRLGTPAPCAIITRWRMPPRQLMRVVAGAPRRVRDAHRARAARRPGACAVAPRWRSPCTSSVSAI